MCFRNVLFLCAGSFLVSFQMAEAGPSGSPDPAPETEPCLKGTFRIGKVLYDVSLSSLKFSWVKRGGTNDKQSRYKQ